MQRQLRTLGILSRDNRTVGTVDASAAGSVEVDQLQRVVARRGGRLCRLVRAEDCCSLRTADNCLVLHPAGFIPGIYRFSPGADFVVAI